jgi:hypothetical protein
MLWTWPAARSLLPTIPNQGVSNVNHLHGHLVGRTLTQGNNELGRWMLGQSDYNYQHLTAYHQQQSGLIQRGFQHPNPRRQFQRDLQKCIRQCRATSKSITIFGDFKKNLDINPSGTAKSCAKNTNNVSSSLLDVDSDKPKLAEKRVKVSPLMVDDARPNRARTVKTTSQQTWVDVVRSRPPNRPQRSS